MDREWFLVQALVLVFGLWSLVFVRDSIMTDFFGIHLSKIIKKPKTKDQIDQCPRVINSPISSTVATLGSTSPTIRPS